MLGVVQVNNLNLSQGPLKEVENYLLFTGKGSGVNEGSLITVNNDTVLDAVLGSAESALKTQVAAARLNAGQNWNAVVLPLATSVSWQKGVDYAMEQVCVEGIAVTDPVTSVTEVEAFQAKAELIMGRYMRPIFIAGTTRGINSATETWEEYLAAMRPILKDVLADQVTIAPALWGPELGTYMGRLCNKSVTVADTPMRVKTGPLLGAWGIRPTDKNGRVLDMSILKSLDASRFSVPQWYEGYEGVYFGDGNVLDANGGDFQTIENLRVVQKAMRRVYPLAVSRIGDRALNETPSSIAAAQTFFSRPLREMCKSRQILGQVFPGEIHPPQDKAIQIVWITKYKVEIWITVRPYNCPKDITCNILLDLTNYA